MESGGEDRSQPHPGGHRGHDEYLRGNRLARCSRWGKGSREPVLIRYRVHEQHDQRDQNVCEMLGGRKLLSRDGKVYKRRHAGLCFEGTEHVQRLSESDSEAGRQDNPSRQVTHLTPVTFSGNGRSHKERSFDCKFFIYQYHIHMPKILDGKVVRDEIMAELKKKIEGFKVVPTLAIIKIGDNPDSDIYVKRKLAFAKKIGANAFIVDLNRSRVHLDGFGDITQEILETGIEKLNKDKTVHGIIVQAPLPEPLDWMAAVGKISPEKDVDGMHSKIMPATARGVLSLLNYYDVSVKGKKVVVMGRSFLVGRPIAILMKNNGAEVTVVHSQTKEPEKITRQADILIVAIGHPELVGAEYVKEGQVIIDVGITAVINADGTRKIYGDVDFDSVSPIVFAISPVPGGVGPMTVASLFQNLVESCEKQTTP